MITNALVARSVSAGLLVAPLYVQNVFTGLIQIDIANQLVRGEAVDEVIFDLYCIL